MNTSASLSHPARSNLASGVLVSEQTAASLLHNVAALYRRHVGVIFWTGLVPMVPLVLAQHVAKGYAPEVLIVATLLTTLLGFFVSAALTVVVSDICLGRPPLFRTAYARVMTRGRWLKVLGTGLLLYLLVWVGLLLLVLPGLWIAMRSIFSSTVVVLEERAGVAAVKRSMALTRGQFWRVNGLMFLPTALAFVLAVLVCLLIGMAMGLAGIKDGLAMDLAGTLGELVTVALLLPTLMLTAVLLYYDQRARRESYDAQSLAEDLMR